VAVPGSLIVVVVRVDRGCGCSRGGVVMVQAAVNHCGLTHVVFTMGLTMMVVEMRLML